MNVARIPELFATRLTVRFAIMIASAAGSGASAPRSISY